jgi:23S rRNA pseudouridine2605 synthase
MAEMRLQRFLASAGVASRRKAEEYILAGRVTVNGEVVTTLGTKVDPTKDRVNYEGQRVMTEDHVWLLLNKPTGCVSTVDDPEGRETVLDIVGPQGVRVYPVGRLDYHTEGVLLLTNDGDLAHALMHPKNQIPRVYHVKVKGIFDPARLDPLRQGVILDTGETVRAQVGILSFTDRHTWLEMVLREGRNRQIHRMLEANEMMVLKLIRVSYGDLTVEGLRPARYRALTQAEVNKLRAMVNLRGETRRAEAKKPGRRQRSSAEEADKRKKSPAKKKGPPRKSPMKKGPPRKSPVKKKGPPRKSPMKKGPRPPKKRR